MRLAALIVVTSLASLGASPRYVTHIRCLKMVAQDTFDRFAWVTRDGRRGDVDGASCHRVRFWRAAGVEWPVEELAINR